MKKINLSLSRLSPVALMALLSNVITKMTGNSNFATPAVAMATLQAALDLLATLIDNAVNGSRQARMLRDDQVLVVRDLLRKQGNYVVLQSNGDTTIQESSGFPMAKTPMPVGVPNTPRVIETTFTGIIGNVEIYWSGSHGAAFYNLWYTSTPGDAASWKLLKASTRNRHSANLPSGTYHFRVSAVGAAGESAMSDVAVGIAA